MILTFVSSASMSWLFWESITLFFAVVGGVVVFCGLWIEKKHSKERYLSAHDFRSSKLKAERGWKLLMIGIFIEIVVAGVFAAKDGWEIRQIKENESKNNPLNLPISDISAFVEIKVRGSNHVEVPHSGSSRKATLMLSKSALEASLGGGIGGFLSSYELEQSVEIFRPSDARIYSMRFLLDPVSGAFHKTLGTARDLLEINFLSRAIKPLPLDAEILGGKAKIIINPKVTRDFAIPP